MAFVISRAFGATVASVDEARRFVRLHASRVEVNVEDLLLVTSELATNALQHGDGGFELTLSLEDAQVVVEIRDRSALSPRHKDADADATSGRGLLIVGQMAESWGFRRLPGRGNAVWARLTTESGSGF